MFYIFTDHSYFLFFSCLLYPYLFYFGCFSDLFVRIPYVTFLTLSWVYGLQIRPSMCLVVQYVVDTQQVKNFPSMTSS